MFRARALRPLPRSGASSQPALAGILDSPLTMLTTRQARVAPENLARVLEDDGRLRDTVWLRLSPLDLAADHLVESVLAGACRVTDDAPVLEHRLLEVARVAHAPMPSLGTALAEGLPARAVIVVEDARGVAGRTGIIDLLATFAAGTRNGLVVLICGRRAPGAARRAATLVYDERALSVPDGVASRMLHPEDPGLSSSAGARLKTVAAGDPALVNDLATLVSAGFREEVEEIATSCRGRRALVDRLAHWLIGLQPARALEALSVALRLGYWNPSLDDWSSDEGQAPRPWLSPLEEGWYALRPLWTGALARALHTEMRGTRRSIRSAYLPAAPSARGDEDHPMAAIQPALAIVHLPEQIPPPEPRAETVAERATPHEDATTGSVVVVDPRLVTVRLFGTCEVTIGGTRIERWDGHLGLMLFKYLLSQRRSTCPRDVLMDAFWPDAAPDVARNRLHVALSGLRRSLRRASDLPVIEFHDGMYRVSPTLTLVIDSEEFKRLVAEGRRADAAGDVPGALGAYERARVVYRDDFLADTPYEDWAIMRRESFRISYLDMLDRMIAMHLTADDLPGCITCAQAILEQDACREDAHRLIMRCHARQGRVSQALRQYEICRRALEVTLECPPSTETARLHREIRSGGAAAGDRMSA